MKRRLFRVLGRYAILFSIGLIYYIFVSLTDMGIPCLFRLITGWQCPGCGVSRMIMALVRFDLVSAFHYNPVILLTSPILLFAFIRSDIDYIRSGKYSADKYQALWIAELVLLLGFGVLRNIV